MFGLTSMDPLNCSFHSSARQIKGIIHLRSPRSNWGVLNGGNVSPKQNHSTATQQKKDGCNWWRHEDLVCFSNVSISFIKSTGEKELFCVHCQSYTMLNTVKLCYIDIIVAAHWNESCKIPEQSWQKILAWFVLFIYYLYILLVLFYSNLDYAHGYCLLFMFILRPNFFWNYTFIQVYLLIMFLFDVFFHAGGVIHIFFHLPTSPGRLSDWQRRIVGSCYAFLGWRTAGAQRIQFFGPHENDDGLALGCHHAQPIYILDLYYI